MLDAAVQEAEMEYHLAYRKPPYVRKVSTCKGLVYRLSDIVTVSQNTFRTVRCDTPSVTNLQQTNFKDSEAIETGKSSRFEISGVEG